MHYCVCVCVCIHLHVHVHVHVYYFYSLVNFVMHVHVKCIHLKQYNHYITSYPGTYAIQGIIPRLPYGQNSLGISEQTTIALLCTLMELCIGNTENARYCKYMYCT